MADLIRERKTKRTGKLIEGKAANERLPSKRVREREGDNFAM